MSTSSSTPQLAAANRELTGKQVKQLRQEGNIPAVVYGHKKDSVNLTVNTKEFLAVYKEAGQNTLVDLSVDGKAAQKVLIHDVHAHPATNAVLHADFYLVNMKEKLETAIPFAFTGEADAVEIEGGTLITAKDELNVECLPQDLVSEITVDISALKTLDDVIRVKDLVVPKSLTVLDDEEETVLSIAAPRSEAELAELDEVVSGDVEVESETGNAKPEEESAK